VVKELLIRIRNLLSREKELLSKPLPARDKEAETEVYMQEMEETLLELKGLGREYFQELFELSADKAKEKELYKELTFLQELYQQREENISLGQEKLASVGKELDRIRTEKKTRFSYSPVVGRETAAFLDSKI